MTDFFFTQKIANTTDNATKTVQSEVESTGVTTTTTEMNSAEPSNSTANEEHEEKSSDPNDGDMPTSHNIESKDSVSNDSAMDVDGTKDSERTKIAKEKETEKIECLESLSELLNLDNVWETLSSCLKDLAGTPDHHAVLVLQATVEAFFLVHAAPTQPDDKKKTQQKQRQ